MDKLHTYLKKSYHPFTNGRAEPFAGRLREFYGDRAMAVIMYGSCLSELTCKPTSYPDFFVVVDRYDNSHGGMLKSAANRFLPPNVYYLELEHEGRRTFCKYNLISMEDLERETSEKARDMYNMGRLTKRVGLVWARDEKAVDRFVNCACSAMRNNLSCALPTLPGVCSFDDLISVALYLSYRGEIRVERDSKVRELFSSERHFYETVYSILAEEFPALSRNGDGSFTISNDANGWSLGESEKFLSRSRRRSVYRWPKGILTFNNYVDVLADKIERARGVRLELTWYDRKFPLIFGWRHFIKLLRRGHIK